MNEQTTSPKIHTKESIKAMLLVNDTWLIRGLLVIYERQTAQEKSVEQTIESNGIGFNGVDSKFLSSLAEQYKFRKFLSPRQIAGARKCMVKYSSQLEKISKGKI